MLLQSGPRGGLEDKCICDRDQAGIQSHSQRGAKAWCVPGAFCLHATSYSFLVLVRVASQGEPPASRELDREERSGHTWPKADWGQTWPSWPQVGPNRSPLGVNLGLTCAELGQLALLGSNTAQRGHVWTQIGPNVGNLVLCGGICRGSWAQDRPNLHGLAGIPIEVKMQVFSVSHSVRPGWAQLGPGLPAKGSNWAQLGAAPFRAQLEPKLAHVELKLGRNRPRLKPCDAGGGPGYVEHGATWARLAAVSHQVKPNGDTIWGTLRNTKRHRGPKSVGNTSDNARFEDFGLGRPCPNFEAM